MTFFPFTKEETSALIKEIIAKGGAFLVLVAWVAALTYQNNILSKKIDESEVRMDKVQDQMFELQKDVILKNTIELHDFNERNRN